MQIVPIKELKDGSRISHLCHESDEPIHVTKNGYADLVIMSTETYERLAAAAYRDYVANAIREGIAAAKQGETVDASEVLSDIREL